MAKIRRIMCKSRNQDRTQTKRANTKRGRQKMKIETYGKADLKTRIVRKIKRILSTTNQYKKVMVPIKHDDWKE